jgi:cyanophycinase
MYSQAFHAYGASSIPIPISSFKPAWKDNQDNKDVADLIKTCDINFFTDGDQTRTTALLYNEDGSDSLALQALRQNLNNGSVVAGSSAGNMMQSSPMITGGNSMGSLSDGKTSGMVTTARGIGLLQPDKLILDSHFSERGRLGRLLVALDKTDIGIGVGVDETTALVVNIDDDGNSIGNWRVIGDNYVTIARLDSDATDSQNADVSILSSGDEYNPNTNNIIPAPYKHIIKESTPPYYRDYDYWAGAVFSIDSEIPYMLSRLVDSTASQIRGTSLIENAMNNGLFSNRYAADGVEIRFSKTDKTEGFYGKPSTIDSDIENARWYTANHLSFNYRPITISIGPR